MADTTDTAPEAAPAAAPKPAAKPRAATATAAGTNAPIKGARIVSRERGESGVSYPAAIYKGERPAKGSSLSLTLGNGLTYRGRVHAVTDDDGEMVVEFADGLTPLDAPPLP